MLQFELKDGKKINVVGNFKIEFDRYGVLTLVGDTLKRQSSSELLQTITEKLDDNFYKEKIAISEEKSEPISYDQIQKKKDYMQLCSDKFEQFINVWVENFDILGEEQPDRVKLLQDTMPYDGKKIMDYVDHHKGLTYAVMETLPQLEFANDTEFRKYCRLVAENITQVSSIICPPLATKLEYPFKTTI